ncbi:MAG: isoprenylcysteine carboxylmethyltransferase family protein [Nitrososphaerales archaeon]
MTGSPFPSDYAASAFAFVFFVWVVSEVLGGTVVPSIRRRGARVQRRRHGYGVLVYVAWALVLGISASLGENGVLLLPVWFTYVGDAVLLAGVALRQWAIAVLGRYFSGVIGVQQDQKVVEAGPYHLIRHPSYAGVPLILIGIATSMLSLAAVVAAFLLFWVGYGYRVRVEEKVLVSELGDSYIDYMKRTKRIIPFLL